MFMILLLLRYHRKRTTRLLLLFVSLATLWNKISRQQHHALATAILPSGNNNNSNNNWQQRNLFANKLPCTILRLLFITIQKQVLSFERTLSFSLWTCLCWRREKFWSLHPSKCSTQCRGFYSFFQLSSILSENGLKVQPKVITFVKHFLKEHSY